MSDSGTTFAVVTGGGTSGHVLPALAIAEALVARGHAVGRDPLRRHEPRRRAAAGAADGLPDDTLLDVVGLQRSLSTRNLAFAPEAGARRRGRRVGLLRRLRPKVVVNVGGYASFPATFAALLCADPVVVVSYDRRPGLVSKLLARARRGRRRGLRGLDAAAGRAHRCAGAPGDRAPSTGAATVHAARPQLGLPDDRFVVAVIGGSLGSQGSTRWSSAPSSAWPTAPIWPCTTPSVSGSSTGLSPERDGAHGILYRVVGYEDRMPLRLRRSGSDGHARRRRHDRRAGHRRRAGDRRALAGGRGEPPGRQRPPAQRPRRRGPRSSRPTSPSTGSSPRSSG